MPFLVSAGTSDTGINHNDENKHQAQERLLFKLKTYVFPVVVVIFFTSMDVCAIDYMVGTLKTVKRDNAIKTDIFCYYIYCRKNFS